ncbi:MAG: type II toxin-antitoxin system ParD family antitoxin [Flavobacteriales bacterium]|nr:type II toxin-antitoxin system ParD family antitoxin [Flavobacteriales bacterium]
MSKNTSILLGDYFQSVIDHQIKSGKYSSASEVIRAALRLFEHEEAKKSALIKALEKGEYSGFLDDFDRNTFLEQLNQRHEGINK